MAGYSRREFVTVEYGIPFPATVAEFDEAMTAVMAAAREELGEERARRTAAMAEARDNEILIRFEKSQNAIGEAPC
jgi:hypothetical protein